MCVVDKKSNKKNCDVKSNKKCDSKEFVYRNSVLTDLFTNCDVQLVKNFYLVVVITLISHFTIRSYVVDGTIDFGWGTITLAFRNIKTAALIWLGFFALTCSGYFVFKLWLFANIQSKRLNNLFFALLIGYYIFSFEFCAHLVASCQMGPASNMFVTVEQTRLLMKLHSFIRNNSHKPSTAALCSFPYFVLFLFFPTLIFRDSYPRTKTIRWQFALLRLAELVTLFILFSMLGTPMLKSVETFGHQQHTFGQLVLIIFEQLCRSFLLLLGLFIFTLHSLQNFFAEITRFGDRLFYQEWWNSVGYSEWMRTWNLVVYDWLYSYIYKDSLNFVTTNRTLAKIFVIGVSAIVHEWWIACALGFWFPILFFMFFIVGGTISGIRFTHKSLGNIFVIYGLALGMAILFIAYGVEFNIRNNGAESVRGLVPKMFNSKYIRFS